MVVGTVGLGLLIFCWAATIKLAYDNQAELNENSSEETYHE
jgi:hypothetical protein